MYNISKGVLMRSGEIWKKVSNQSVGIIIEDYDRKEKMWTVQHVDFIDNRTVRSYIFEKAKEDKIRKLYFKKTRNL